jgi:hypothetical protein
VPQALPFASPAPMHAIEEGIFEPRSNLALAS